MPSKINDVDWKARERIFDRAVDHRGSVYYTYQRNYFAAKCVGWLGWSLDVFTAILGGVLIFVLRSGNIQDGPTYLAVGILVSSLISSFYGPKLRSRDYYQAGQEHQELYDKFEDFVQFDIPDPSNTNNELRKEIEEINQRRHQLNQSTPQLGGIWYYTMKMVEKIKNKYSNWMPWKESEDWEADTYEEIIPEAASKSASSLSTNKN